VPPTTPSTPPRTPGETGSFDGKRLALIEQASRYQVINQLLPDIGDLFGGWLELDKRLAQAHEHTLAALITRLPRRRATPIGIYWPSITACHSRRVVRPEREARLGPEWLPLASRTATPRDSRSTSRSSENDAALLTPSVPRKASQSLVILAEARISLDTRKASIGSLRDESS